jgi:hypothetical protein
VLYTQTAFGRESTVTAKVTVGAEEQPSPVRLSPIGFVGLRVEARANKAGGFVETWSAESLMETARSNAKSSVSSTSNPSSAAA